MEEEEERKVGGKIQAAECHFTFCQCVFAGSARQSKEHGTRCAQINDPFSTSKLASTNADSPQTQLLAERDRHIKRRHKTHALVRGPVGIPPLPPATVPPPPPPRKSPRPIFCPLGMIFIAGLKLVRCVIRVRKNQSSIE